MNLSPVNRLAGVIALTLVMAGAGGITARAAVEPAVPVRMVAPVYPDSMRRDGVSGVVSVVFEVDEKGNVTDPKVQKSSNHEFEQPALDAIVKWKFKPGLKDGVPIKMKLSIPLKFSVDS